MKQPICSQSDEPIIGPHSPAPKSEHKTRQHTQRHRVCPNPNCKRVVPVHDDGRFYRHRLPVVVGLGV